VSDTTTTLPTTLVLKHVFKAPIERVYDAWVKPEIMCEFMRSADIPSNVEAEVRVGGGYRIVMHKADGDLLVAYGTYRELTRPTRIVCTWQWEEDEPALAKETLLTLDFVSRGADTELTLTHEDFRDEAQRDNHAAGWGRCFANLELVLG